jgi:hypothetical protein
MEVRSSFMLWTVSPREKFTLEGRTSGHGHRYRHDEDQKDPKFFGGKSIPAYTFQNHREDTIYPG